MRLTMKGSYQLLVRKLEYSNVKYNLKIGLYPLENHYFDIQHAEKY